MNEEYAALLAGLPLFQGFTIHGAKFLLEGDEIREHEAGAVLCREGDPATFVLLVLHGTVEVFVERQGRTLHLTEAGGGAIIGELAVLCGIPRAASLRAREKLVVLHWSTEGFRRMMVRHPSLSERILRQSLRLLIDKEQALIDSLCGAATNQGPSMPA
jgi:CRP-like cAMP-binding protein